MGADPSVYTWLQEAQENLARLSSAARTADLRATLAQERARETSRREHLAERQVERLKARIAKDEAPTTTRGKA